MTRFNCGDWQDLVFTFMLLLLLVGITMVSVFLQYTGDEYNRYTAWTVIGSDAIGLSVIYFLALGITQLRTKK